MFEGCASLRTITIPASVTSIGGGGVFELLSGSTADNVTVLSGGQIFYAGGAATEAEFLAAWARVRGLLT